MNTQEEQKFLESVRSQLEERASSLDAHTLSRLHSARSHALESVGPRPAWHIPRWWLPTGAVAAAALMFVLGGVMRATPPADGLVAMAPEVTEMVASEENLEIATDLDFYRWLDEQALSPAHTDA